jgi:enoyl-CoA hydratase
MLQEIQFEVTDGRARITLNRPEKRNALSLRMQVEICEALWEADNDKGVHSVILRGAGISFCAGYDLARYGSEMEPSAMASPERAYRTHRSLDDDLWQQERAQRFRMSIFDMHKPCIAQVQGHCLGGGTDIALLCDMVIAADDAVFGFPPARDLGSLPNNMWIYHVGPQWAKRLTLTGDTITGTEAQQIGLVLKAVPSRYLEQEVEQLADRMALIDPDLLSVNKRSVNIALELMGARTTQRLAAELNVRGHNTQAANDYRRSVKEKGLKATFAARDAQFGDGRARVKGPEIRGGDGRLKETWD